MSFLLDTCFLSELAKPNPAPRVAAWASAADESLLFVSTLTFGELQKGISRLPDSRRRQQLQAWLSTDLLGRFQGRCLPVTTEIALRWGQAQAVAALRGRPVPVLDGLIGATALVHGLTVVTRNTADMAEFGVPVFNPWNIA